MNHRKNLAYIKYQTELIEFDRIRNRSVFCRLLLADQDEVCRDFSGAELCSIAFTSSVRGRLSRMDDLFIKYEIEEKATRDFKSRLREIWLNEADDERRRNKLQRLLGAICEVAIADHLSAREKILKLSATSQDCKGDIESVAVSGNFISEVKLIGEVPGLDRLRLKAGRGSGVAVEFGEGQSELYNYVGLRLAQATEQLKAQEVPRENRRVILAFYTPGQLFHATATRWLRAKQNWASSAITPELEKLNSKPVIDFKRSIESHLEEVAQVICATFDGCEIQASELVFP